MFKNTVSSSKGNCSVAWATAAVAARATSAIAADTAIVVVVVAAGGCDWWLQLLYKSRDSNEKAPLKERFANRVAAD